MIGLFLQERTADYRNLPSWRKKLLADTIQPPLVNNSLNVQSEM